MKDLINQARDLMQWADEYGIDEIDLSNGDEKIRIARAVTPVQGQVSIPNESAARKAPVKARPTVRSAGAEENSSTFSIVSPMVGTFYHSASPEAKPYKVSGDQVKAGDTVCIVEAMKVMNQIKAPKAGEIKRILVNNAEVVYKGQALMEIG
jgi:acetyl-CoA carboxylase biotin carboxyl carrier protein